MLVRKSIWKSHSMVVGLWEEEDICGISLGFWEGTVCSVEALLDHSSDSLSSCITASSSCAMSVLKESKLKVNGSGSNMYC